MPPSNSFSSVVFALSRDLFAATFSASCGLSVSRGAMRWRLLRLATVLVGQTIMMGPGLVPIEAPRQFSMTVVLLVCAAHIRTTSSTGLRALMQSCGSCA